MKTPFWIVYALPLVALIAMLMGFTWLPLVVVLLLAAMLRDTMKFIERFNRAQQR